MAFLMKMLGLGEQKYGSIDADEYKANFLKQKNHTMIDVRTTGEFAQGHIPGAKNIPLDQLRSRLTQIDKNKPVIVVCQSGNRSRSGSDILVEAGWSDVRNFKGGTMAWRMRGFELKR